MILFSWSIWHEGNDTDTPDLEGRGDFTDEAALHRHIGRVMAAHGLEEDDDSVEVIVVELDGTPA